MNEIVVVTYPKYLSFLLPGPQSVLFVSLVSFGAIPIWVKCFISVNKTS